MPDVLVDCKLSAMAANRISIIPLSPLSMAGEKQVESSGVITRETKDDSGYHDGYLSDSEIDPRTVSSYKPMKIERGEPENFETSDTSRPSAAHQAPQKVIIARRHKTPTARCEVFIDFVREEDNRFRSPSHSLIAVETSSSVGGQGQGRSVRYVHRKIYGPYWMEEIVL